MAIRYVLTHLCERRVRLYLIYYIYAHMYIYKQPFTLYTAVHKSARLGTCGRNGAYLPSIFRLSSVFDALFHPDIQGKPCGFLGGRAGAASLRLGTCGNGVSPSEAVYLRSAGLRVFCRGEVGREEKCEKRRENLRMSGKSCNFAG